MYRVLSSFSVHVPELYLCTVAIVQSSGSLFMYLIKVQSAGMISLVGGHMYHD